MCLLLIINITLMSNFFGDLIQQIFSISPHSREYDFKGHVVVIGPIEEEQINHFLEELIENDLVERSLNILLELQGGIKCIVVIENVLQKITFLKIISKEPTTSQKIMADYLSDLHDNEIVYLKENIFG